MTVTWIANVLQWVLFGWLGLLVAVFLRGLLLGRMKTEGLLASDRDGNLDPERVLLLVTTLGIAFYYTVVAIGDPLPIDPMTNRPSMPDLSTDLLYLLAGAQAGYVGGKTQRLARGGLL